MAKGNEGRLIDKIHRQTDKYTTTFINDFKEEETRCLIHRQKMNMDAMSSNGTPDVYYEGPAGNAWIEYKVIDRWEGRRIVPVRKLSALQKIWLLRCTDNNQNAACIIGDAKGKCIILEKEDLKNTGLVSSYKIQSPKEVAIWIAKQVL